MKELEELFVRRGRSSGALGRWYMLWRTRCGQAAVARARVPGYATVFYALYRQGQQWLSIEHRPDGLPRRYRSRAAAARAVLRYLRRLEVSPPRRGGATNQETGGLRLET